MAEEQRELPPEDAAFLTAGPEQASRCFVEHDAVIRSVPPVASSLPPPLPPAPPPPLLLLLASLICPHTGGRTGRQPRFQVSVGRHAAAGAVGAAHGGGPAPWLASRCALPPLGRRRGPPAAAAAAAAASSDCRGSTATGAAAGAGGGRRWLAVRVWPGALTLRDAAGGGGSIECRRCRQHGRPGWHTAEPAFPALPRSMQVAESLAFSSEEMDAE